MLISQFITVIAMVMAIVIITVTVTVTIVIISFLIGIFAYCHGLYEIFNPSLVA